MIEIDKAKALELLRAEVAEQGPDFVYKKDEREDDTGEGVNCHYVENGCPSCLVGRALARAGFPIEVLVYMDNEGGASGSSAIDEVEMPEGYDVTPEARAVLQAAQVQQDKGWPWAEALIAAEKQAERV